MFCVEKQPFLTVKTKLFHSLKNGIFLKGLTHDFGLKNATFLLYVFGQTKLEIILTDFVDKKEPF